MKIVLVIIIIIYGLVGIVSPKTGVKLSLFGSRWMIKDAEPTKTALIWSRIGGAICIIIAISVLFSDLSF
jgi:hypothetical protein